MPTFCRAREIQARTTWRMDLWERGQQAGLVGGDTSPPEENTDRLGFIPECAHLLLQGVYGDFPHHNDGAHLDVGIADDAT